MTQATPGPWTIGPNGRSIIKDAPGIADGYDHYMIAVLSAHSLIGDQEAKANASLIVRAVNERDELIAALELCAGAIEPLRFKAVVSENCTIKFTGKYTHLGQHRLSEILDRANAILEKAKAQ